MNHTFLEFGVYTCIGSSDHDPITSVNIYVACASNGITHVGVHFLKWLFNR